MTEAKTNLGKAWHSAVFVSGMRLLFQLCNAAPLRTISHHLSELVGVRSLITKRGIANGIWYCLYFSQLLPPTILVKSVKHGVFQARCRHRGQSSSCLVYRASSTDSISEQHPVNICFRYHFRERCQQKATESPRGQEEEKSTTVLRRTKRRRRSCRCTKIKVRRS